MSIYNAWLVAKETEAKATASRRSLEDLMIREFEIKEDFEGTRNVEADNFNIKIVGRMNRKIDQGLLHDLAVKNGMLEHAQKLFRWKAEINATLWKNADEKITTIFSEAITTSPGRPSFSIEQKGE